MTLAITLSNIQTEMINFFCCCLFLKIEYLKMNGKIGKNDGCFQYNARNKFMIVIIPSVKYIPPLIEHFNWSWDIHCLMFTILLLCNNSPYTTVTFLLFQKSLVILSKIFSAFVLTTQMFQDRKIHPKKTRFWSGTFILDLGAIHT